AQSGLREMGAQLSRHAGLRHALYHHVNRRPSLDSCCARYQGARSGSCWINAVYESVFASVETKHRFSRLNRLDINFALGPIRAQTRDNASYESRVCHLGWRQIWVNKIHGVWTAWSSIDMNVAISIVGNCP